MTHDVDFKQIASRLGGPREAFEELCCQLARRTIPEDANYVRLHGAGGDGGIECFADISNGNWIGWQAKYVFDAASLIAQASCSLEAALRLHPRLNRYIVCFPFDLTGPTHRRGLSGLEKFNKWRREHEERAATTGRRLVIDAWPASELRNLLLTHDSSGGIREYFFNRTVLTNDWFNEHLNSVEKAAGPRYTPELNVQTDLWRWFAAFGRTAEWCEELDARIQTCRTTCDRFSSRWLDSHVDPGLPTWTDSIRDKVAITSELQSLFAKCGNLASLNTRSLHDECVDILGGLLQRLSHIESRLADDVEVKHGRGTARSPGFRQFMAEHMCSFPTANLDDLRELTAALRDLCDWLRSPDCSLAYEPTFALSGVAGAGKTHGVCAVARQRYNNDLLTCVVFGHEFRGEPDPWTRLAESLGLPATLGMNLLLDALSAAGEASGRPLVVCIDAINETRPLRYWRDRLAAFTLEFRRRPHLRLVVTCRNSYLRTCLPDGHGIHVEEHVGFADAPRIACQEFFRHYELEPPIPLSLQPEMSNPLYLRLLCETLKSQGLRRLPLGWRGLAQTIRAFLKEKESRFSTEYEMTDTAKVVTGSLKAIACGIADSGEGVIPVSLAQNMITDACPRAAGLRGVLDWLIREDLLIEDAPTTQSNLDEDASVRVAFERLGDFLVALELLARSDQDGVRTACQPEGILHALWRTPDFLSQNEGVISAVSILISENEENTELPYLVENDAIREQLVPITVGAFPARDPATFSEASSSMLKHALARSDSFYSAMDAVLSIAWQPSVIDAKWLDTLLKQYPLAVRDSVWCGYLYDRFEKNDRFEKRMTVRRLIDGVYELPPEHLDVEVAERWALTLLWFTAAADRRVKDEATRAATRLLSARPKAISMVLDALLVCDDDEIRERAILGCYGALILSRDAEVVAVVADVLRECYMDDPNAFENALIRDHIRCVLEFARELNVLQKNADSALTISPMESNWPLELPDDNREKEWSELLRFWPDEFMSDFFKYSMNCLRPWEHAVQKKDMGRWILRRIAHDFGYQEESGCREYDRYILACHGGGSGKPSWAERIGKKYAWTAMYQLASRLHDHVDGKEEWSSISLRTPLILLEERKLDPTLPKELMMESRNESAWWMKLPERFYLMDTRSDEEWIARVDDIQMLEDLIPVVNSNGQSWRVLVSYLSSLKKKENRQDDSCYHIWMQVQGYLVQRNELDMAWEMLHRRNFFGRWMPDGADFCYGFVGEYPWGPAFSTDFNGWVCQSPHDVKLPVRCEPCWNSLAIEWEYDATVPQNRSMIVPARRFFFSGRLWWNGRDGYRTEDGRSVFRDPSMVDPGPASLLADVKDLQERLERLELCVMWTLLGEKVILDYRHDNKMPIRKTFSQIASLDADGSMRFGERVFFDDYERDASPVEIS